MKKIKDIPRLLKIYLVIVAVAVCVLAWTTHVNTPPAPTDPIVDHIYSREASNPGEARSEIAKNEEALTTMMQNIYGPDWTPTAKDRREMRSLSRGSYEVNGKITDYDDHDSR